MPKLYPDQKDVGGMDSISLNSLSSVTTLAVQQPLLPLPPSDQQSQHLSQFTEEFDFEAMNEKFKKDEVWGYLGKANQRDNIEGIQHNVVNEQNPGDEDHSGSVPTGHPKTFGNFQERTHSGYSGGYAGGRGAYNWGRGYNPSGL